MSSLRLLVQRSLPLFLVAAGFLLAWSGTRAAGAAPSAPSSDALEEAMGEMNMAMKALGKSISAETRTAALEELTRFQQALLVAKAQTPDTAAEVEEKERAAFVAEFRTQLLEALKVACDVEIAVVNGKYADASGLLEGKLAPIKSAGHDKFQGDD